MKKVDTFLYLKKKLKKRCQIILITFKGDTNKLAVHELGGTPKLFALTSHEERTIQRNATMAFGLLSAHSKIDF